MQEHNPTDGSLEFQKRAQGRWCVRLRVAVPRRECVASWIELLQAGDRLGKEWHNVGNGCLL
jgi:hypothetical protein